MSQLNNPTFLADPATDTLLYPPPDRDPKCWVGAMDAKLIDGVPHLTRRLRGPVSRGRENTIARYGQDGWQDVVTIRADEVRCGKHGVGTRSLEKLAVSKIGFEYVAIYCALDWQPRRAQRPDRWDLWAIWAEDPRDFDPSRAVPVAAGDDWAGLAGQDGGRKDPTIATGPDGAIELLYVAWSTPTGPATTWRARWDGNRFVPERRPLFPADGCAAAEARLTDVITLPNGRRIALADVAARREQNTRETGVWLRVPADGGLGALRFGDELPAQVAGPGLSCRYGTGLVYGDEVWFFYEALLGGPAWNEAHGGMWSRRPVAEFGGIVGT